MARSKNLGWLTRLLQSLTGTRPQPHDTEVLRTHTLPPHRPRLARRTDRKPVEPDVHGVQGP
jgi:hypothetical protein